MEARSFVKRKVENEREWWCWWLETKERNEVVYVGVEEGIEKWLCWGCSR